MLKTVFTLLLFSVTAFPAGLPDTLFNNSGTATTAFGNSVNEFHDIAVQPDGRIVVVGYAFNGSDHDIAIARFNPGGSLDQTFDGDGKQTTAIGPGNDYARAVALQTDGKIVVAGSSSNGAFFDFALVRYNSDGSLDGTFGNGGKVRTAVGLAFSTAFDVAIGFDGKITAVGDAFGDERDIAIVRYLPNGTPDAKFDNDGIRLVALTPESSESAYSVALQPDGKIVVAGGTSPVQAILVESDFVIVRLMNDGTPDNSFGSNGIVILPFGTEGESAEELVLEPGGKLVVSGRIGQFGGTGLLVRLMPNGAPDPTFGGDGSIDFPDQLIGGHAVQPDGKIVFSRRAGSFPDWTYSIDRMTAAGGPDADFGTGGSTPTGFAGVVRIQTDGKPLSAATVNNAFSISRFTGDSPIPPSTEVSGRIVNISGRAVPFARVSVTNAATGETRVISANYFGYFSISALPTGQVYRLRAESKRTAFPELSFFLRDAIRGLVVAAQ